MPSNPPKTARPLQPKHSQSPSSNEAPAERKANKRRCVSNACIPCRRRKSKCDGSQPVCSTCVAVYKTDCSYDAETGDNRRKASLKRNNSALQDGHGALDIIISSLRSLPEAEVTDLVNQIRSDENLDALAESLRQKLALSPKRSDTGTPQAVDGDFSFYMGNSALSASGPTRHFGHTACLGLMKQETTDSSSRLSADTSDAQYEDMWTRVTGNPAIVRHLLDLYFTWTHPFYMLFSKDHFYNDFETGQTKYCSSLLVNALCAYACHDSDLPIARADPGDPKTAGKHFHAEAIQLLNEDMTSRLTTVQALAVMSMHEASCGNDSAGYSYMGRCLRMAIEMGLHLNMTDVGGMKISAMETEARKHTFWGCFALDNAWSISIGRLSSLPRAAITLEKPRPAKGTEPHAWVPYTDNDFGQSSRVEHNGRDKLFLEYLSSLSEIINDTMYQFYAPRERTTKTKVLTLYRRYQQWYKMLPKPLQVNESSAPHVLVLHMYYWDCVLHLFRPLVKADLIKSDICPRAVCIGCCHKISGLMTKYREAHGLRRILLLTTHFLLSICTIYLIDTTSADVGEASSRHLLQSMHDLEVISADHNWATRCLKELQGFSEKWKIPLPAVGIPPTPSTPSTQLAPTSSGFYIPSVDSPAQNSSGRRPSSNNLFSNGPMPMFNSKNQQLLDGYHVHAVSSSSTSTFSGVNVIAPPITTSSASNSALTTSQPPLQYNPHAQNLHFLHDQQPQQPIQQNAHSSSYQPDLQPHHQQNYQHQQSDLPLTPTTSAQLFWSPFPWQQIPLSGPTLASSPMDLSSLLLPNPDNVNGAGDWDPYGQDGFKMSTLWGPDPVVGAQNSGLGMGVKEGVSSEGKTDGGIEYMDGALGWKW